MEGNTASLRSAASQWTLAGDKQLLDILQNIHQSLVTRCQEVNRKLDEMVLALDGASVDLQNVNNKFMALSNSQFVESRVYDDDVDVAVPAQQKQAVTPPEPPSSLEGLKSSIRVLEEAHDLIEIVHSDSEDSDGDIARTVLKTKDRYSHRPLPYIIGSNSWRSKWHAGLHPDDSDSDSAASRASQSDQYSDSEPEPEPQPRLHRDQQLEESTSSSEAISDVNEAVTSPPGLDQRSPSDIAAELARRLGGNPHKIPEQKEEYVPPDPIKKVYRPDQPSAGTVFCDEPPPLDQYQSDEELPDEEDDIFAELHKSKPYNYGNKDQSRLAEDLFSGLGGNRDMFNEDRVASTSVAKKALFEDKAEPELFSTGPRQDALKHPNETIKKPVGGISLFGNNKGAETIGAAILKRNQRKYSDNSDDSAPPPPRDVAPPKSKEKDIFDDLFAKSEREQKRTQKKEKIEPVKSDKVDLFSDNLFDDIDDIFTTNVNVSKDKKETLFDDDDDIFSDVAVAKDSKVDSKSTSSKVKSIFDSDDDLFTDNVQKPEKSNINKIINSTDNGNDVTKDFDKTRKENENLDDIFANIPKSEVVESKSNTIKAFSEEIANTYCVASEPVKTQENNNDTLDNDNHSLFSSVNKTPVSNVNTEKVVRIKDMEKSSKSLFEDEDDDELFAKKPSSNDENSNIISQKPQSNEIPSKSLQKSSLFDDDSDENDLFGSSSKPALASKEITIKESNLNNNKVTINDKLPDKPKENPKTVQKATIFDDLEEDDIFATSKQANVTNISKQTGKNNDRTHRKEEQPSKESLFNDNDEDSSLFNKIHTKPVITEEQSSLEKQNISRNNQEQLIKDEPKTTQDPILSNDEKPSINDDNLPVQKLIVKEQEQSIKEEQPIIAKPKIEQLNPQPVRNKPNITDQVYIEPEFVDSKDPPERKSFPEDKITNPKEDSIREGQSETVFKQVEIESETPVTEPDTEAQAVFAQPKDALLHSPAVFDDIFSEPPAFEKSLEPKKSKNVNALFDDDSDDEALFFKKNDATLDEKPDLAADGNKDVLFGIFHDEPPAMDIDFTQKATKINLNDDFLNSDSDDDFFSVKSKKESTNKIDLPSDDFSDTVKIETAKIDNANTVLDKAEMFEKPKTVKETTDTETKKVGKLKTINLNINVNTLLPGASPKKKSVEQVDGQALGKTADEIPKDDSYIPKTEPYSPSEKSKALQSEDKLKSTIKSISFEGEPDSNILDNKLSKERAKIQVKRRPSTRRARKEAVRKSAINLADDSTDNSSSFDEPSSKSIPDLSRQEKTHSETINIEPEHLSGVDKATNSNIDKIESVSKTIVNENKSNSIDVTDSILEPSNLDNATNLHNESSVKTDNKKVTSKIVYILNDEDIFSNPSIEKRETSTPKSEIVDNLFKNTENAMKIENDLDTSFIEKQRNEINSENNDNASFKVSNDVVNEKQTQSKIDNTKTSHKKSLFDDLNDDNELFNPRKAPKKSILDSDSGDELFGGSKRDKDRVSGREKEKARVEVKSSLFDDEDGDDLFGNVKSNISVSSQPVRVKEVIAKPPEPVFEDPLSLLGGEED